MGPTIYFGGLADSSILTTGGVAISGGVGRCGGWF